MQRRCRQALAAVVAVIALVLFGVGRTVWFEKLKPCDDEKDVKLVMWSWEFARRCCDVYPSNGEVTSIEQDLTYFGRRELQNGSIVYVKVTDFAPFLQRFVALPPHFRITLVSGMDDVGPVEAFSAAKSRLGAVLPVSLAQFLADERLRAWFAQNYDLGCNVVTQSCLSDNAEFSQNSTINNHLLAKIRPLPLGIDLHTWADKGDMFSAAFQAKVCQQRRQLKELTSSTSMSHYDAKDLSVVWAFSCVFKNPNDIRKRVRGELCRLLTGSNFSNLVVPSVGKGEAGRIQFWRKLQRHTFAFAPPGAGLDTHRFWEILLLQSVPIVISSPLDVLYSQFPVLIVSSWQQAFNRTFLAEAKNRIKRQWGLGLDGRGALSASTFDRLTIDYWMSRVNG